MNYDSLSKEILIGLRGKRTQRELSKLLGYDFNQVGKWESGATLFHWPDFTKLCDALEIPWRKVTEDTFLFHSVENDQPFPIFSILCQFHGPLEVDEIALALNKSRSSVLRLQHDQVKLDFVDVLRLMDLRPYVLQNWLGRFVDLGLLSSGKEKFDLETRLFKSLLSVPWAPVVNAALRLEEYNRLPVHSDEWIAEKTALSSADVKIAIDRLLETGAIYKRGEKYFGLFKEITMLKSPEFRRVTQYLNQSIAKNFKVEAAKKPNLLNPSISSTRVYPVSDEASRAIADAVVEFHHKVSSILKSDAGTKTHVRAIVLHCIDMSILTETRPTTGHEAAVPAVTQPTAPLVSEV